MIKLDIQLFGGRGASSGSDNSNMFSTNIPKKHENTIRKGSLW